MRYLVDGRNVTKRDPATSGLRSPMPYDVGIPANANEINRELKKLWGIDD